MENTDTFQKKRLAMCDGWRERKKLAANLLRRGPEGGENIESYSKSGKKIGTSGRRGYAVRFQHKGKRRRGGGRRKRGQPHWMGVDGFAGGDGVLQKCGGKGT